MLTMALRRPLALGLKVTLKLPLPDAVMEPGKVKPPMLKSAACGPVMLRLPTAKVSVAVPVF